MEVNQRRDNDGLTFAQKAMIEKGLYLITNGVWELSQFLPKLQGIVGILRNVFEASRSSLTNQKTILTCRELFAHYFVVLKVRE